MKKRKNSKIKNVSTKSNELIIFSTKNLQSKRHQLAKYNQVIDEFQGVTHQTEGFHRGFEAVVTDVDVRPGFTRQDYEAFRPAEKIPTKFKDIIIAVRSVYKGFGAARNVIDLMTDFACEDLRFVHPKKNEQAFYQVWAQKIGLKEVVNQFARHLLVDANVVTKTITAKLSKPAQKQLTDRLSIAEPDIKIKKEPRRVEAREIPWKYTFLDPARLQLLGNEGGLLSGVKGLVFKIPKNIISVVQKAKRSDLENMIVKHLPKDIKEAIKNNKHIVTLDMSKITITHSKKDDWEPWATPFMFAVLPDVFFKEKLRQAELSALDGVINVIRIWRLGDHKEGILPNTAAVSKLINILNSNTGGGALDIVWDSMLDMKDFYPPIGEILGSEKYDQINKDIMIGLGVPEVLLGGTGGNFSNSSIQLKTIVERLEYVRERIIEWLTEQTSIIAEAMGFKTLPRIHFNQMNLKDENVEKRLITGLLDRGIISAESVLQVFGQDFAIEVERIREQDKLFDKTGIEVRGPFHGNQNTSENVAPSPGGGRPTDTKETTRKTRTPAPRASETLFLKACGIIEIFDTDIIPIYMKMKNVKNARQLTAAQRDELDALRRQLLACINLRDNVSKDVIFDAFEQQQKPNTKIIQAMNAAITRFTSDNGKEPTLSEKKKLEAYICSSLY